MSVTTITGKSYDEIKEEYARQFEEFAALVREHPHMIQAAFVTMHFNDGGVVRGNKMTPGFNMMTGIGGLELSISELTHEVIGINKERQ